MGDHNQHNDEGGVQGITKKRDSGSQKESIHSLQPPVSKALSTKNSKQLSALRFGDVFFLTMKTYNKTVGTMFRDAPYLPRPLKVLDAIVQFFVILGLTGVFSIYINFNSYAGSILVPYFI